MWQGSAGNRCPYADQVGYCFVFPRSSLVEGQVGNRCNSDSLDRSRAEVIRNFIGEGPKSRRFVSRQAAPGMTKSQLVG